jgi:hypothetical protein
VKRRAVDVLPVDVADHRDARGLGDLDHHVGVDGDGGLLVHGGRQRPCQIGAVVQEHRQQGECGYRDRGELEPVLEGLYERDRPHAAADHIDDHDGADDYRPHPDRKPQQGLQRQPGALILRDQVEHADEHHDQHRDLAQSRRGQAELGKVGDRVCARATQRRGHEQQQPEIARREPDRVPQRIGTVLGDQARNTEKRGRREVFTRDGRRVPLRADAA